MILLKRIVALLLSSSLVLATGPAGFAYQEAPGPPPQAAPPPPDPGRAADAWTVAATCSPDCLISRRVGRTNPRRRNLPC